MLNISFYWRKVTYRFSLFSIVFYALKPESRTKDRRKKELRREGKNYQSLTIFGDIRDEILCMCWKCYGWQASSMLENRHTIKEKAKNCLDYAFIKYSYKDLASQKVLDGDIVAATAKKILELKIESKAPIGLIIVVEELVHELLEAYEVTIPERRIKDRRRRNNDRRRLVAS